jgi:hypothetical protein
VPTDLADLVTARTEATLQTELLAELVGESFPTADWQEGSVPRSLVKGDAAALADLDTTVASLAGGAFLSTAEGLDDAGEDEDASWLDLLAQERFDETRIAATFAEWALTLTAGSGIGPYTIGAGALIVASSGGLRFQSTNASNVTVPLGGATPITVKAQRKGTSGNTATPSVIVSPALPGVTISAQTLATSARDRENDDSLRQRCMDKWSTLAVGQGTQAAYRYWCINAVDELGVSCGITKVAFDTIPGTGAVPIWVSGADENIGSGQLADAQAYVDERKPLTDTPTLSHATEVTVDVSGMTVTFKAGQDTDANRTAARAAIVAYFSALPISTAGDPVTVDEAGVKASVYTALPGKVKDIDWSGTDTTLSSGQVAISSGTGSITFA